MFSVEYLRSFKLGEYAIFDLVLSFLGIYLLAPLLSKIFKKLRLDIPKISWILFTLPIGILVHLLVGNITPMTHNFFEPNGNYGLKVFVLVCLLVGLSRIKIIRKSSSKN